MKTKHFVVSKPTYLKKFTKKMQKVAIQTLHKI